MKTKTKVKLVLVLILVAAVVIGGMVGCHAMKTPDLSCGDALTLKTGDTYKVKVSAMYVDKESYSSSDKKVAKISNKGKITAVAPGSCTIKTKVTYRMKKDGKQKKKTYKTTLTVE